MAFFVKMKTFNKDATCYTFGTTGTGLSPCLTENTKCISNEDQFSMKDTEFELMHTFTFLTGTNYDSSSHTHYQQHPEYNYYHHCP